jgi:hypothetical protein
LRKGDGAVDCCFDLGTREADIPQCAIVELVKACNGGATEEIARDPIAIGDSVHAEAGSRTIEELEAERDEILLGLLELRSNAAKTAAPREIAAE